MVVLSSFIRVAVLWLAFVAAVWVGIGQRAEAQNTYYWDSNGATAGFGSGTGTWGSSTWWSTNASGTITPTITTTGTLDALNFGTATDGFLGTTIGATGNPIANSLTFGSASSGTISFSQGFSLGGINPTITVNNAFVNLPSGVAPLAGTNGLIKSGTGVLALRDSNSFTGGLIIKQGGVDFGNSQANIPAANTITLGDPDGGVAAAQLLVKDNSNKSFSNPIVLGKSTGVLSIQMNDDGANFSKTFTGGVTGTNNLAIIHNAALNNLNFTTSAINNVGAITHTGTTSGTTTFSSVIGSNVTNFVQDSTAVVRFQAVNTYTGTTTIAQGTLVLDTAASIASSQRVVVGTAAGSSARLKINALSYTFGSPQTLMGSGTVAGSSGTITIGGTLSPGNSPGVLTFDTTSLRLSSTSNTIMEITGTVPGTLYDVIDINNSPNTGTLTYGGTLTLNFSSLFNSGTFNLFQFGSGASSGSFASILATGAMVGTFTNTGTGVWQLESGQQTLTFTQQVAGAENLGQLVIVPEPVMLGLVGIAGGVTYLGIGWRRRRRRGG